MEQTSKELLLKDLCGRLPYGVKFACNKNVYTAKGLDLIVTDEGDWEYAVTAKGIAPIEMDFIKPYLFPLSSMTEEQYEKFIIMSGWDGDIEDIRRGEFFCIECIGLDSICDTIDWFNKNHFDYRGLIPMGLANDATGLNIYYMGNMRFKAGDRVKIKSLDWYNENKSKSHGTVACGGKYFDYDMRKWCDKTMTIFEVYQTCYLMKEDGYKYLWTDEMIEGLVEEETKPKDMGEVSDGYHTFNELYEYRMLYNAALFNEFAKQGLYDVHKSRKHSDGDYPFGDPDWFIVMAELPTGQISNHYEMKDWDKFQIPEKPLANEWDGHSPRDVADRLTSFTTPKKEYTETYEERIRSAAKEMKIARGELREKWEKAFAGEIWTETAYETPKIAVDTEELWREATEELQNFSRKIANTIMGGLVIEREYNLPEDYQFVDENGNVINTTKIGLKKKKKEYPKTYEECINILRGAAIIDIITYYYGKQLNALYKLLICRDAYWKIAGEEMGLGKPWKPDWTNKDKPKFVISIVNEKIKLNEYYFEQKVFAFPTKEMRDAFKENFDKDLEFCKELL